MFTLAVIFCLLSRILVASCSAESPSSLKSYNVDIRETSVSGISSGGYFATQMQVAFSSIIKGAGIVAAGPYDCGGEKFVMYCMQTSWPYTYAIDRTKSWSGNRIDNIKNMKDQRVYMISGKRDSTVSTSVVDQLFDYYRTFVKQENIVFNKALDSGHTFPTDFDGSGNNRCQDTESPFVSNCHFDGAGAILQHIYGDMKNRTKAPQGELIKFNQAELIHSPNSIGMSNTGYIYVPKACQKSKCRLHVVFHGCKQSHEMIGTTFIDNAGYQRWADNNKIILLYPQTHPDMSPHFTMINGWLNNMNGCWDWIGWYDAHFQSKDGKQMSAVRTMIDKIAGVRN